MTVVSRSLACLSVMAVLVFLLPPLANAEIPQVISYQGKVTDSGGTPIPDGTYSMRFSIYDVATGGSSIWYSGTVNIPVTDGIFSVLLGATPGQPAIDLPFDTDYWLGIWIEGSTQTPRQRLGSIGYAYMSSGLVPGTEVIGSVATESMSAFKGVNTAASGATFGLYGVSLSSEGTGVRGDALATTGATFGVRGASQSTSGAGVYGSAEASSGTTYGVYGLAFSGSGRGVYGVAASSIGLTYGIYGEVISTSGRGVYGVAGSTSGTTYGVFGISSSTQGRGVYGKAEAASGETIGVIGTSSSTFGKGVSGEVNSSTGSTVGVYGYAASIYGKGMSAFASANEGQTYGLHAKSASSEGRGVHGWASATSGTTYGVYGRSDSPSGYGVYYSGGINGSGAMRTVVLTSKGPTSLDAVSAAGSWAEDFGEGQLVDGRCHIELDPLFMETVTIDAANPMKVFITPDDPACKGVAVVRGANGFEVMELHSGTGNSPFAYRVVAKRKGFEQSRLDYCKAAETDPYLYPDLRQEELPEPEIE